MKKLFTLVALLACFMGAKAEWVEDYKIDYSTYNGFPFYVMGYVPEWIDGIMTDFGANYAYVTMDNEAGETSDVIVTTQNGVEYYKVDRPDGSWHQYFIADGIKTELDGSYTIKALVKASEAVTININMGWGWGEGQQLGTSVSIPASDEFQEVEWEYSGIGGTSCNLVAQPGTATAVIEWKELTVSHEAGNQAAIEWIEQLENGDAETPWADPDVRFDDQENNFKICAWGKEKGVNMNDDGGWDPFPATIEVDPTDETNHVFVVHANTADTDGDASAWDNQFWIQSPKSWRSGTQVKIHFRYRASRDISSTDTQIHHQNPSDYLIWHAIGNIHFTEEWQEYDDVMTFSDDMDGGWSIAFNLNSVVKDATDFYFDDLSWQAMKLDEGLFVAASNAEKGIAYNYATATEFVYDDNEAAYRAVVGTQGKEDTWVNEVMISTVRGNDAAFKGATLKPSGSVVSDPDTWLDYTESTLAKIKLPAAGVWQILVDTDNKQMNFVKLQGEEEKQPLEEIANTTEIIVKAKERQYTEAEGAEVEGLPENIGTEENPWGQPWDSQFWIVANRKLDKGEATIIKFKYKSTVDAKVSTQCHADPGAYLHWGAIGDINFAADEWQEFETTFTVPDEADGMQSIAFNMAEIKADCDYYITDVIWMTEDHYETLINTEGTKNFMVKEFRTQPIHEFGTNPGGVKGDVNGDGAVNVADISAVIDVMAGSDLYKVEDADVNGDQAVNVADISKIIDIMAGEE